MDDSRAILLDQLKKVYPLKMFTDLQREAIAASVPLESYAEKQLIYQEDDEAHFLNLVIQGQVQLFLPVDEDEPEGEFVNLGELEAGDIVGLEALEEGSKHLTYARALTPVILARMNLDFLEPLFDENSLPVAPLKAMLSSLKLFLEVELPWRNPNEAVILFARRHIFFLISRIFLPAMIFLISLAVLVTLILSRLPGMNLFGMIAGLIALITGLFAIWIYVDWSNDFSIVTNQRAVFQEKVILLYDSRQETPLESILATSVDSSQIGRILGYGDVILKTYTGTLIFPNLALWDSVRLIVDDRRGRAREVSRQIDKSNLRLMVRERLGMEPPKPPATKPEPEGEHRASLGEFIANVFRMRSEKNGVITYRTHWFKLLTGIFLPSLAMIGLVALLIVRLMGVFPFIDNLAFMAVYLLLLLVVGFWLWYRYTDWHNDIYIVSDEQVVDVYKKPLGQEEKRAAPLKSIQSVEFERLGIIGLVLNFGTVFIRIGDTRFTFNNIYNPSEVQRDLFRRIAAQADRERRTQAELERQRILDVLEAYHNVTNTRPDITASGENQPTP